MGAFCDDREIDMAKRISRTRDIHYYTTAQKATPGIYLATFLLYLCPVLLSGIGYVFWEYHKSEPPPNVAEKDGTEQTNEIAFQKKKTEEFLKEIVELKSELDQMKLKERQMKEKELQLQAMLEQKPETEPPPAKKNGGSEQADEIALQKRKIAEYSNEIVELKSALDQMKMKERQMKKKEQQLQAMLEQASLPAMKPAPEKEMPGPKTDVPIKSKKFPKEKESSEVKEKILEPELKSPSKRKTRPGLNIALTIQKEGFESLSKDNAMLQLQY